MKTIGCMTILFLFSACLSNFNDAENKKQYMQCRLEIYCTKSHNSIVKKGAFKVVELYFKTELGDGICEKHYQAWGFDYRSPAVERCGRDGDFVQ